MHIRKIIFLFLNQNICCGYSEEPSPRSVLLSTQNICKKLWVREYLQFYAENFCLSKPMEKHVSFPGISLLHCYMVHGPNLYITLDKTGIRVSCFSNISPLTFCRPIYFSIMFDTVKSGQSIVYIEGSQVIVFQKIFYFSED